MAMVFEDALGVLKQRYPGRKLQYIGYKDNPLLALIPKDPTFDGKVYDVPLWYGGNQGGSATFARAQANKTGGLYGQFLLTRIRDYALTSVPTEAVLASMSDIGSFLKLSTGEVDNCVRMSAQNLDRALFKNHGGARGQVASTATVTLTLLNINDVANFEVGMVLDCSDADGTSGAVDADLVKITKVDYNLGTLTAASNWNTNGNYNANDFLFRDGDFGLALSGFDDWFPSAAPSSTAFFGQDRSTSSRLSGQIYDGTSENIDEALLSADIQVAREGGRLSHYFMNHADFSNLRKSLGSKVIYDKVASPDMASIGFRTIVVTGVNGDINVVADRHAPSGICYGVEMDSLILASLGPCPRFLMAMGQGETIWDFNADSVEFRSGYYAQLGVYAPNHNVRIALPTG